jgi:hypothetical protein
VSLFRASALKDTDTVALAVFNGQPEFGVNSTAGYPRVYTPDDLVVAQRAVRELASKYPGVLQTDNLGQKPNDVAYHAEGTMLFRLARSNGGHLENQDLEIHVDRPMCPACRSTRILPLIARELGNPTVTYIDSTGARRTLKDGKWQ